MATGGNAIRGTRVGAGPMGEQDHGHHADRVAISYWDALGNETVRYFAAGIPEEEIPEVIDSPHSGLPAGRDRENPPAFEPPANIVFVPVNRHTGQPVDAGATDAIQEAFITGTQPTR